MYEMHIIGRPTMVLEVVDAINILINETSFWCCCIKTCHRNLIRSRTTKLVRDNANI